MQAKATFEIKSWDEKPYDEFDGRKMTKAHVVFAYTGEFEGEGKIEYVMAYDKDGNARFVGMERITGSVGGHAGSFVIQHIGHYQGKESHEEWEIVPGSGTGQLEGISGSGKAKSAAADKTHTFTLTYTLKGS